MEAVLFDLDGTLVITHIDFAAMRAAVMAEAEAARVARAEIEGRDVLGMVGIATGIVRERDGEGAACDFLERAEEAMAQAELRGLEGAGPAPFAGEVLAALSAREVRVGIVTRNCRRITDRVLALSGLECPVILTRNDVARCKPDPLHLLEALARLAVAPEAAVMVGDHTMDIEAGRAAGTRTVGVITPGRAPDFFAAAAPDLVVPDLRGVLPFVLGAA